MTIYSFDADSFIASWRVHYPNEYFPGIWDSLDQLMRDGRLLCAEPVYEELERGGDDLFAWLQKRKSVLVPAWDEDVQVAVSTVQMKYPNMVARDGKSGGDPWVVALAMARSASVVTYEVPSGPGAKIVKIPTVCKGCGIPCMTIVGLIRKEQWVLRRG